MSNTVSLSKCNLRPIQYNDADRRFIRNLFANEDVKKFYVLTDTHSRNLDVFVLYMIQCQEQNRGFEYIIENKFGEDVGLITGEVRINQQTGEIECNVGYAISPKHRHEGFASEALNGLTDMILNHTNIHRVVLDISEKNVLSQEVAKNCGFAIESPNGRNYGFFDVNHPELGSRFKWVKIAQETRRVVFQDAVVAYKQKNWPLAVSLFQKALECKAEPGFPDSLCYSNMGMAYSSNRQYYKAFECLKKAQSLGLYNASIARELQWLKDNLGLE